MPKLLLGFILIVLTIVVLYINDPPKTICDMQMESVMEQLNKGFFAKRETGLYGQSIESALKFCLKSNSSGGCRDMFSRLSFFEKRVKSIPTECGNDSATAVVHKALRRGLRLLAEIAWGEKPPASKFDKTAWLETNDIGLFCRLKAQYQRLYGDEQWRDLAWSTIGNLPGMDTLSKKDLWERSLFSYPCAGLF